MRRLSSARSRAAKLRAARRELRSREAAEGADRSRAAVERSGNKDWQALARRRSSLERGPPRAGPPKGQAAPFAALPISQVERTAGAVSRRGASLAGVETCSGADRWPTRFRRRAAEDAAARAARRARREHGAVRRLRDAGPVPRRHHRRAPPLPRVGGLFDVSHMGQLRLVGADAAAALETLVPVDVVDLAAGKQRYALFTDDAGGILDDLMVTRRADDLLLIVNAALQGGRHRAPAHDIGDRAARIEPMPDHALLALQGPKARRR